MPLPANLSGARRLPLSVGGDGRPSCVPFHFHEMQAHQADRGLLDYSALVVAEARWEDLDPLEFERLRRSIRERRGRSDETLLDLPDLELAKALGAVDANSRVNAVRVLGLLLFGKEEALRRLLPTHEVALQVLRGQAVEVNDFFRWPLLRVMEEIDARYRARNSEQELLVGLLRVGVPDGCGAGAARRRGQPRLRALGSGRRSGRTGPRSRRTAPDQHPWQERTLATDEAARLIQKPEAEARGVLHRLVEAGLVEARGERKGRVWHLSAGTYRRLGDKAAYVRQRGFEPLQQEQMALQYVEKHGRITRREAAELCRLSPDQAYRLLTRLTKRGMVARYGTKRGAWYERRA